MSIHTIQAALGADVFNSAAHPFNKMLSTNLTYNKLYETDYAIFFGQIHIFITV